MSSRPTPPTVPSGDPLWRDEFSVYAADERYVSRRQFAKFLTLTSVGMLAGQVWILAKSWMTPKRTFPVVAIASAGDVPVQGVKLFRYPTEHDTCILVRPDAETFERIFRAAPHIPILVLCTVNDESTARLAVHRGAQEYLLPSQVDAYTLRKAVRLMLERDNLNVFSRLGPAFAGLHYMLGFDTVTGDSADRGKEAAERLNDGWSIRDAWIRACTETEGSDTNWAYLRADGPGTDTFNDHWHGKGFVSPDPTNPTSRFYLRGAC
jgi:hypothetical protein